MNREARSIRCPESVLGWIPWYGETDERGERLLDERQRGAIEAHASECADCRTELDMIAGAPYEIDVALPDPDRLFEEITARIDAGEAAGMDTAPGLPDREHPADRRLTDGELGRLAGWLFDERSELELLRDTAAPGPEATAPARVLEGPWARSRVWLAAAAVFAVGLLAGRVLTEAPLFPADAPGYELAAAESARASAASLPGERIDVVFVDTVTVAELASELRVLGVEIVSGPSSVGRYRLRVLPDAGPGTPTPGADAAAIAARLKAGVSPLALYAEPVTQ